MNQSACSPRIVAARSAATIPGLGNAACWAYGLGWITGPACAFPLTGGSGARGAWPFGATFGRNNLSSTGFRPSGR